MPDKGLVSRIYKEIISFKDTKMPQASEVSSNILKGHKMEAFLHEKQILFFMRYMLIFTLFL